MLIHNLSSFSHKIFLLALAAGFLLIATAAASAQCVQNPAGETAVGLQNASSYYLTFYIDGASQGGVPSGDKSLDVVVTPGVHILRAEAVIGGEAVSAVRTTDIPEGYVCTWTVTDPAPDKTTIRGKSFLVRVDLSDSLLRR